MTALPAPDGLREAGRTLWASIADPTDAWDLRPDELAVLERACRVADRLAILDDQLDALLNAEAAGLAAIADGHAPEKATTSALTTRGSMGQEVEAPVLASLVRHDALLQRLLASLKLPDLQTGERSTSEAARKAATARWSKPRSA